VEDFLNAKKGSSARTKKPNISEPNQNQVVRQMSPGCKVALRKPGGLREGIKREKKEKTSMGGNRKMFFWKPRKQRGGTYQRKRNQKKEKEL